MSYALTLKSNPGLVTNVSDGAYALPEDVIVSTLPSNYVIGELWYINGRARRTDQLTNAERTTLGLETQSGSSGSHDGSGSLSPGDVSELEPRDITLGDPDDEGGDSSSSGSETGSGSGGESGSESGEESGDAAEDTELESVGVGGGGTLVTVYLSASGWTLSGSGEDARYRQALANQAITHSTVLLVNRVNGAALPADLDWESADGMITFTCPAQPQARITILGVLMDPQDEATAKGTIRARPGADWQAVTYRQSLHVPGWSVNLIPGASVSIETPVDMRGARLLFGTPSRVEGTDAGAVLVTGIFVNAGGYLCYSLANAGLSTAVITDADIRILYAGALSGFVFDSEAEETVAEYISYRDFAEI